MEYRSRASFVPRKKCHERKEKDQQKSFYCSYLGIKQDSVSIGGARELSMVCSNHDRLHVGNIYDKPIGKMCPCAQGKPRTVQVQYKQTNTKNRALTNQLYST